MHSGCKDKSFAQSYTQQNSKEIFLYSLYSSFHYYATKITSARNNNYEGSEYKLHALAIKTLSPHSYQNP